MREAGDIIAVLLAGGRSRRMGGGDKCLRLLAGRTMLEHVIARLRPQVGALVLNANGDPARFAAFGLPVISDPRGDFAGPLAGMLAGLHHAIEHHPRARFVLTAATDTPFLPLDLAAGLLERAAGRDDRIVIAASSSGLHPTTALVPVSLAADLEAAIDLGIRAVLDWTARHDRQVVEFAHVAAGGRLIDPFLNANTPDELAAAGEIAAILEP